MHSTPAFSFVIPAYKRQFLSEAIDSMLAQSFTDFELIVVNDKSPEGIKEIVDHYNDPRISYHENATNMGRTDLVASWNHAASYAKGEYIIVASDDDFYSPDFLSEASELIQTHPECDTIRAIVHKITEQGDVFERECRFEPYLSKADFAYFLSKHGFKCSANYIYRRQAFDASGGFVNFPCAWYSDVATPLMMANHGVLCMQKGIFYFRTSATQVSADDSMPTTRAKLTATAQYREWANEYCASLDDNLTTFTTRGLIRKDINLVLLKHMQHVSLLRLPTWWKHVWNNKQLYKYERFDITLARLFRSFRRN